MIRNKKLISVPYEKNICSKMSCMDMYVYLKQAFLDKEAESDMGYYSNFVENENAVKSFIDKQKGNNYHKLLYMLDRLYES